MEGRRRVRAARPDGKRLEGVMRAGCKGLAVVAPRRSRDVMIMPADAASADASLKFM